MIGKHVCCLIGKKGVGKSTLANAFISGPNSIQNVNGQFINLNTLEFNGSEVFKINSKSEKIVEYYPLVENDTYLVDMTGVEND